MNILKKIFYKITGRHLLRLRKKKINKPDPIDVTYLEKNQNKILNRLEYNKNLLRNLGKQNNKIIKELEIQKRYNIVLNQNTKLNYLNTYNYNGKIFQFYDNILSFNPDFTIRGIIDVNEYNKKDHPYYIKDVNLKKGDIVIDIGANLGIFSIYLGLLYPDITIYAFEPVKQTYDNLVKNIEINNVKNVKVFNLAVTKDGRDLKMYYLQEIPGSSFIEDVKDTETSIRQFNKAQNKRHEIVKSTTLDDILKDNKIKKVKLLKIDCEGSEDEILRASEKLSDIEHIIGEIHYGQGSETTESLKKYLSQYFDKNHMKFEEV